MESSLSSDLPCVIFRVDLTNVRFSLSYAYNIQYLNLIGVLPVVFMDTIMKNERTPEIIMEKELFLWNSRVENMIKSHDGTVKL